MLKIVGTAFAAAALLAAAASADSANQIRTDVAVAYSDLDLSSESGARALLARLDAAATEACGGSPVFYSSYDVSPSWAHKEFATCKLNAITAAVKTLPYPQVQKLYASAPNPLRLAVK